MREGNNTSFINEPKEAYTDWGQLANYRSVMQTLSTGRISVKDRIDENPLE